MQITLQGLRKSHDSNDGGPQGTYLFTDPGDILALGTFICMGKTGKLSLRKGWEEGEKGECGLIWGVQRPERGSSPHGATAYHAGDAQPASAAGRPPTRSSAGNHQAPGDTGTRGSQDTDSRPSWEGSKKDSMEMASLTAWHPDPCLDQPVLHLSLQSASSRKWGWSPFKV